MKRILKSSPQCAQRLSEFAKNREDRRLTQEIDNLLEQQPVARDQIPFLVKEYLCGDGSVHTFNSLRFDRSGRVAQFVNDSLQKGTTRRELCLVMRLLEGFDGRARNSVVQCVLDNWTLLQEHELERACGILAQASIRNAKLREDAKTVLNERLMVGGEECVRDALNRVLSEA